MSKQQCCCRRGPDVGMGKVLSGLCARRAETAGGTKRHPIPLNAPWGSRCPTDVVPDSNGSSYALWWAQVRLLKQKRAVFELNFP
jgi:hypothetical protein